MLLSTPPSHQSPPSLSFPVCTAPKRRSFSKTSPPLPLLFDHCIPLPNHTTKTHNHTHFTTKMGGVGSRSRGSCFNGFWTVARKVDFPLIQCAPRALPFVFLVHRPFVTSPFPPEHGIIKNTPPRFSPPLWACWSAPPFSSPHISVFLVLCCCRAPPFIPFYLLKCAPFI